LHEGRIEFGADDIVVVMIGSGQDFAIGRDGHAASQETATGLRTSDPSDSCWDIELGAVVRRSEANENKLDQCLDEP
jgi:hypothetical protein